MRGVILNDLKDVRHLNKIFWLKRLSFLTQALQHYDNKLECFASPNKFDNCSTLHRFLEVQKIAKSAPAALIRLL